jgi:glycine dehydrogenase subunit 1
MRYVPHTPEDIQEMLEVVGVKELSELFSTIPDDLKLGRDLDLPESLPECMLNYRLEELSNRNTDSTRCATFAGAGIYNHYVPAAVGQMLLRSELYTAYTPYQPEVSQGTLQSIFEYQTMIARLLGMEVSNASLYDGSTAVAEAVGMSLRIHRNKRPRVLMAESVHPEYVEVARTYLTHPDEALQTVAMGSDGRLDLSDLDAKLGGDVASLIVQSPSFYGLVEDLAILREKTAAHGVLLVVAFSEAMSYAMLQPPGAFDADIVVGEGQSFGMPVSYGGPLLGIMATRKKFVRALPGRLVGKTVDRNGEDAYVVTLATREQHIRRERATSNICTNEGLCALSAALYLTLLGNSGLQKLATVNHHASRYLASRLATIPGVTLPYGETPWFNEFAVELPQPTATVIPQLVELGIVPGVAVDRFLPEATHLMLVTCTELSSRETIDNYVEQLRKLVA